ARPPHPRRPARVDAAGRDLDPLLRLIHRVVEVVAAPRQQESPGAGPASQANTTPRARHSCEKAIASSISRARRPEAAAIPLPPRESRVDQLLRKRSVDDAIHESSGRSPGVRALIAGLRWTALRGKVTDTVLLLKPLHARRAAMLREEIRAQG